MGFCLSVCPCSESKTAQAINTKLGRHSAWQLFIVHWPWGQKVKVQGYAAIKCAADMGMHVDTTDWFSSQYRGPCRRNRRPVTRDFQRVCCLLCNNNNNNNKLTTTTIICLSSSSRTGGHAAGTRQFETFWTYNKESRGKARGFIVKGYGGGLMEAGVLMPLLSMIFSNL